MSKIIKAKVGVICRSRLDNSRCHAKTEFNSYFIIHIIHISHITHNSHFIIHIYTNVVQVQLF